MRELSTVILAAGRGERMKSDLPKVMHKIIDKPMIGYVIDVAKKLKTKRCVVVLGFGREKVLNYLKGEKLDFYVQEEQKGTAHALLCVEAAVSGTDVLVLYGDVPLIEEKTLKDFLDFYRREREITFMVTRVEDPKGYGRVVMDGDTIERIVEEKDADPEERKIGIVNTGICVIPSECFPFLKSITNLNRKGEFYLTDICSIARKEGRPVRAFFCNDPDEVLGINTKIELFRANEIMRKRIIERHLENGVTICGPDVTIGAHVMIGVDVKIGNNVEITGRSRIGDRVEIGDHVVIKDCEIEEDARIGTFVYMEKMKVKRAEWIGNFSFLVGGESCAE